MNSYSFPYPKASDCNAHALVYGSTTLTYSDLKEAVAERANWLQENQIERVAIGMDNHLEWVLFDLACLTSNVCCIPLPGYFTESQTNHILMETGTSSILTLKPEPILNRALSCETPFDGVYLQNVEIEQVVHLPEGTQKITFTSGSTGSPKGVCLSIENQINVAESLKTVTGLSRPVFLSLLPLATLLENVAGVYGTLMAGGTVVLANENDRGFSGSKLVSPESMLVLLSKTSPNALNLVPELLMVLLNACQQGWKAPESLQFIAVGGSKVDPKLLTAAAQLGLPVYQGYGLSECASVVAINHINDNDLNSVGQILPHLQGHCRIENGELVVSNNVFLGYIHDPQTWAPKEVRTGDLASLGSENENRLFIEGRKKNLLINSFGRNISPEWPESLLLATGQFRHVVVFGDAKPFCTALLVPLNPMLTASDLTPVMAAVNAQLPDYAQIQKWFIADQPLSSGNGLLTANMRPKRNAIFNYFSAQIEELYSSQQA
ncbi:AMP-binding protein [Paraneptunicella aestuarii]|uniref:AMP-binding protein n=1 Tax=Paraneptunicella aestuarii TaxID=2831148 RepID=UPI001E415F96|nr:AMP-binding protein [Paraneptunicella aestuarii]UAA40627.1 AMP-binding protein [Paraneptunicella aestuarii]